MQFVGLIVRLPYRCLRKNTPLEKSNTYEGKLSKRPIRLRIGVSTARLRRKGWNEGNARRQLRTVSLKFCEQLRVIEIKPTTEEVI
jgi:hypothetical protein